MPLLQHIEGGRIGRAAAELQAAVGVDQPRRYYGGIVRKPREILCQAAGHVGAQLGVVVEHEAETAAHLPERQVVVLRETAHLVAFDEPDLREIRLCAGEVLRREAVGHHQHLMADAAVLPDAEQAGIQIVRPVHADRHHAHEGSRGMRAAGFHVSCREVLQEGRGRARGPQGRRISRNPRAGARAYRRHRDRGCPVWVPCP